MKYVGIILIPGFTHGIWIGMISRCFDYGDPEIYYWWEYLAKSFSLAVVYLTTINFMRSSRFPARMLLWGVGVLILYYWLFTFHYFRERTRPIYSSVADQYLLVLEVCFLVAFGWHLIRYLWSQKSSNNKLEPTPRFGSPGK